MQRQIVHLVRDVDQPRRNRLRQQRSHVKNALVERHVVIVVRLNHERQRLAMERLIF